MTAGRDPIEEALVRAPDVDDAGFTARVMARLPPPRHGLRWATPLAWAAAAAALAAFILPGATEAAAAALAGVKLGAIAAWAAPLGLGAAMLLLGELELVDEE